MYRIKDAKYGAIIEETLSPVWAKQQDRVDSPILAESLEEADGVVLSDGITMLGIEGRNMQNYTPTVLVEEIPLEERILEEVEVQNDLQLASMQGQADQYKAALATQEQVNAQQQLILANMQGLADVYTTLLTMQAQTTPNETEEQ